MEIDRTEQAGGSAVKGKLLPCGANAAHATADGSNGK